MNDEKLSTFGIVDYCLFAGVLIISVGIGLFMSFKRNKSPEEFLMGNRSLNPLPVAMSLLTSFVSAVGLLGFSGEVYANGMQISTTLIGMVLAIIFSSHLFLPILYPLKLLSVNEFIELRFRSKGLCLLISMLSILRNLIGTGIILYAPTIVLASITKLNTLTNILLLGTICTLYSSFGGVRGIIWTDVFQLLVILIGLAALTIVGIYRNGGVIEILYTASKGERLQFFNMNPSPFVRHTFFNTILFAIVSYTQTYSTEQICFQRICAVISIKKARRVLTYNIYGIILIHILIFSVGLVAYANYAGCDPMALGLIKRKEEILPYFVMDNLSFIPGFPGILAATIIGGSLSTVSTVINGCVALIWRDICLRFDYFQNASASYATLLNKIISLVVGSLLIISAIISSKAGSLIEFSFTMFGTLIGPLAGIFMIGFFLPKCNMKGVWTGFFLSLALSSWITFGGLLYKKKPKLLPFSADNCENSNFTSINATGVEGTFSSINGSMEDNLEDTSNNVSLYEISYTLYPVIGTLLCILIAVIVSFITGNQNIQETSPKFISHVVRKFYWTEEEISSLEGEESELKILNETLKESNTDEGLDELNSSEKI